MNAATANWVKERGVPSGKCALAPGNGAEAAFQAHLKVEVVKGTRLISVTYRDDDPVRAAKIANAVVDASIDAYTERSIRGVVTRLEVAD